MCVFGKMCDFERIFQKQHSEISACDYACIAVNVENIVDRVTHIIDCEAYSTSSRKTFLREVSVWCKATNITKIYHIFMPNKYLFNEYASSIKYQIHKVHGLPVVRERLDGNYYLYDEVMCLLRTIFCDSDLIGYKGGLIERNLLRGFGLKGINLEVLKCPKYSELLTKYGVEQQTCGKHLYKLHNHCSWHEVQLFGRFVENLKREKWKTC